MRAVVCAFLLFLNGEVLTQQLPEVNFVLVGATGNLAQKYLWQSLYLVSRDNSTFNYNWYGGARAATDKGLPALKKILTEDVKYDSDEAGQIFVDSVEYNQLKSCEDYESLCQRMNHDFVHKEPDDGHCSSDGYCGDESEAAKPDQIFYLSVPPFTYGELGQCISRVCSPSKIVLEKPYGTDVETVNNLISELRSLYRDEQVYLVDHYLGKTVVRNILPFRFENRGWLEPILNSEHVEQIEVVIKEKEDVKGRLNYYDSYGVFLDILQNHAVELLTLVAMELPQDLNKSSSEDLVHLKVRFLDSIKPITPSNLIYAQYENYANEGKSEFNDPNFHSHTPTFGGVLLRSSSHRWTGVPMLLLSGKALDAKSTYVRIVFKNNNYFSVGDEEPLSQIVFAISSNYNSDIQVPAIAVSHQIVGDESKQLFNNNWIEKGTFHVKEFNEPDRAYFRVVDDVINGRRENFVSLKQLKSSWEIWNLALKHLKEATELKLYKEADMKALEFRLTASGLRFKKSHPSIKKRFLKLEDGGRVSVAPETDLVRAAINVITEIAKVSVSDFGSFHIAFPGGSTPKVLFQALSGEILIPWDKTHVWFVDERCTKPQSSDSNFRNAYENLLKYVQVPVSNIHPMPVHLSRGLCHADDEALKLYSAELEAQTNAKRLDMVVLGVGSDGHVASLFPGLEHDENSTEMCLFTEAPASASGAKRRMSLTWHAIKTSRVILVLITGSEKRNVVKEIFEGNLSAKEFPVKNLLDQDNVYFLVDKTSYHE